MIKKFIALFILFSMTLPYTLAAKADTSNHAFSIFIPAEDVPFGSGGGGGSGGGNIILPNNDSGSSGLSTGGIVGIAVGVSGGLLALGGLGYLLKRQLQNGFTCGQVFGYPNPIIPLCVDENSIEKIKTQRSEYVYLNKALEVNQTKDCENAKYILVPDTLLANKSINTVFFELPEENDFQNIKITMASDSLTNKQLELKMHTNIDKDKLNDKCNQSDFKSKEIRLNKTTELPDEALLRYEGKLNYQDNKNYAAVTISINSQDKKNIQNLRYGFVIEFSK